MIGILLLTPNKLLLAWKHVSMASSPLNGLSTKTVPNQHDLMAKASSQRWLTLSCRLSYTDGMITTPNCKTPPGQPMKIEYNSWQESKPPSTQIWQGHLLNTNLWPPQNTFNYLSSTTHQISNNLSAQNTSSQHNNIETLRRTSNATDYAGNP